MKSQAFLAASALLLLHPCTAFTPAPLLLTPHRCSQPQSSSLPMFTGIVEDIGTVVELQERADMELWDGSLGSGTVLTVGVPQPLILDGAYLGCSISVSGVCLTATALDTDDIDDNKYQFTVGLAPETLRKTTLGSLRPGDAVNLERASEMNGSARNSGHFVQGHVDGVGDIVERWVEEDSLFFRVKVGPELIRYIVPKGFIAIDGTSLTVVDVDNQKGTFTFMLIEYTQKKIIVGKKEAGDQVNIEVDVLAKYAESTLNSVLPKIEALEDKVRTLEEKLEQVSSS